MSQIVTGQFGGDLATFVATNLDPHFELINERILGRPARMRTLRLFDPSKVPNIESFFFQTRSQAIEELAEEMGTKYPYWADQGKIMQKQVEGFKQWIADNKDVAELLSQPGALNDANVVAEKLEKVRKIIEDDAADSEIAYNETYLNSDLPYAYVRNLVRAEWLLASEFEFIVMGIQDLIHMAYRTQNETKVRIDGQKFRGRVGRLARSALDVSKLSSKLRSYPDLCNSENLDQFRAFKRTHFKKLDRRLFQFHVGELEVAMSDLQRVLFEFDSNFRIRFEPDESMKVLKEGLASLLMAK